MANTINKDVKHLSLNYERSCFACGSESGFTVYNVEPLANVLRQDVPDCGGIGQVHMLNRSNLFALVGTGRHMKYPQNRVVIWDASLKKPVFEYTFCSPVLNVRMRKDMILVVLQKKLYAYSFPNNSTQLFCYDTRDNPRGLFEISSAIDSQMCAFPGPKAGSIQLVDLDIKQIGVSSNCINFSADSAFLCASSDKGTIHIFAIKEPAKNKRSTLSKVGLFGQYAESQWGLANFSVQAECPCICVFGPGSSIIAICYDGTFHKYVFTKDGNCNRESYDLFIDVGNDEDFI